LTNNALPTNLGNICVQGGTARWGLIFVSATQINGVADPLSTSGNIPVSVITNCGLPNESPTAPVNVAVAAVSPQFLFDVQNPSGQNEVVAVEALTGARVGPSSLVVPDESFSPAHAGDILTAYGVSWGATSPAAVVGSLAPAGAANITADYTLTVGGKTAVTSYAGLAPTFAGLYQVNFTVPSGLTPGNQPIVLTVGGVPTPAGAFLAVQ
jgi:adhesin/invasin